MPRAFDSDEQKRTGSPLMFSEIIDCPNPDCNEMFDGIWIDKSISAEDMVEPPKSIQQCPRCGSRFEAEYTGWANYGDA